MIKIQVSNVDFFNRVLVKLMNYIWFQYFIFTMLKYLIHHLFFLEHEIQNKSQKQISPCQQGLEYANISPVQG